MAASSCSQCGGKRWAHYFSETKDGNFEEAFRLCPCNHEFEARGEDRSEEPDCAKNIAREKLVSHIKVVELRVELW